MTPGVREHKAASLRLVESEAMPEDMRDRIREIVSLKSENPRKGHATTLLWSVCHEADQNKTVLILQPKPFGDGAMDDRKLEGFYNKFGFVRIQDAPVLMARQPKPRPKIEVVQ